MLRTRQSASKDGAVENWAEKGLRESPGLSPPKAKPSPVKGTRGALSFHKPVGMKGLLWKRSPFTHRGCDRRVFGSALPSALPIAPPLVRARGAHCKTAPRLADGEAIALPFVAGPERPCHIFLAAVAGRPVERQRAAHNVRRPVRFAFRSRRPWCFRLIPAAHYWRPARCQHPPS